jgi:ABC-type sugar transport system ATPase subunit
MRVELAKLHSALGNTMIYVTHDQVEGMTLADRIVIMNAGVVEQDGAPLTLFNYPANKFVAGFLGQPPINFIKITCIKASGAVISTELPGGVTLSLPFETGFAGKEAVEIGVRPEDAIVTLKGAGLKLTVDVVEHLGNETILYGRLVDDQLMTVRLVGQAKFEPGDTVFLDLAPEKVIVFDRNGKNLRKLNG